MVRASCSIEQFCTGTAAEKWLPRRARSSAANEASKREFPLQQLRISNPFCCRSRGFLPVHKQYKSIPGVKLSLQLPAGYATGLPSGYTRCKAHFSAFHTPVINLFQGYSDMIMPILLSYTVYPRVMHGAKTPFNSLWKT